jgi:hypothetical protein
MLLRINSAEESRSKLRPFAYAEGDRPSDQKRT